VRALLVMFLLACGAPAQVKEPAQRPANASVDPPAAPNTSLQPASAASLLDRYRGKVLVLDFWAGWCAECKRTVPQIQRLATAFAADGLVVVGVNAGESSSVATAHARDLGIAYPIALDPELELSDRLGAGSLPMLLVVDRDGTIVHRAKRVDPETLGVIRKLLRRAQARPE
jgi:thiol-disulfide isomerase/thioredoxin